MRRLRQTLAAAAGCSWIVLAVLSLVPGRDRPHTGLSGNFEHMLAYALAAFVTRLVFRRAASPWQILAFACAAAVFEICQMWIPGRSPDLGNWAASSFGAMIGVATAAQVADRLDAKEQAV